MAVAADMGIDVVEVRYLKAPPSEEELRAIIDMLEDPVENLVRKDAQFKKLGLNEDDYVGNADAVVATLVEHPRLLQRPIIVRNNTAIIGRPLGDAKAKDRLAAIFS